MGTPTQIYTRVRSGAVSRASKPCPDPKQLALELIRTLAAAPGHSSSILKLKHAFCGATRPITDLHAAMGFAESKGWIAYSRDYLSIWLRSSCPKVGQPLKVA
jgi:hypothetical protein